jgi:hypothetical protein
MSRRFCRVGLEGSVPDESTIRSITHRRGSQLIDGSNRELLDAAKERSLIGLEWVRVDTIVEEADITYPTDSGFGGGGTVSDRARPGRLADSAWSSPMPTAAPTDAPIGSHALQRRPIRPR